MIKKLLFWWLICAFAVNAKAQDNLNINIDELIQLHQKPVILFFSADYCHYCTWMKKTTFSKKNNQKLNDQFLFIEINEQFRGEVLFKNERFIPQHQKTHPFILNYARINEQLAYPTTLVIHQNKEIIFKESGFINRKTFLQLVKKLDKTH